VERKCRGLIRMNNHLNNLSIEREKEIEEELIC